MACKPISLAVLNSSEGETKCVNSCSGFQNHAAKNDKDVSMVIYRLERNGIGPFVSRSGYFWNTKSPSKQKKAEHVLAQIPVKLRVQRWDLHNQATKNKDHMFGAKSKEFLKAYFGFNLKPYFKQGFKIREYIVPDDEVIDMGVEVAFPVKYHKLKTPKNVRKKIKGYF